MRIGNGEGCEGCRGGKDSQNLPSRVHRSTGGDGRGRERGRGGGCHTAALKQNFGETSKQRWKGTKRYTVAQKQRARMRDEETKAGLTDSPTHCDKDKGRDMEKCKANQGINISS